MPTFVALLILVAGLGPGEAPEYEPAGDSAYTLDLELDGYINGRMDSARLMRLGACILERDAAYTYSLMVEAAAEDGVRLRPASCYRNYGIQQRAYDRRCPVGTVPVFGDNGVSGAKQQIGTRQMRVCSGPPTAQAGQSNHGWGRAVDFRDSRGIIDCYDNEFHWLKRNGYRFGWVHPVWAECGRETAEPWHWEYAGVTDPSLVDYVTIDPALIATAE
jgi:D-alanyl-D-alanine carboxypeptidase